MAHSTLIGSIVNNLEKHPEYGGAYCSDIKTARKHGLALKQRLYEAKRYHLSNDFVNIASTMGFNVSNPLDLLQQARTPFPDMWIEWSNEVASNAMNLPYDKESTVLYGAFVRHVVGTSQYIITPITYYGGYEFTAESTVSILYDCEHPIDQAKYKPGMKLLANMITDESKRESETSDEVNEIVVEHIERAMRLGYMVTKEDFDDASDQDERNPQWDLFVKHTTLVLTPKAGNQLLDTFRALAPVEWAETSRGTYVYREIDACVSTLRLVLGTLSLLNMKEYIVSTTIKPGQKRSSETAKPSNQPAYNYVVCNAPHKVILHIQKTKPESTGQKRPRHEVSGTWVTYHKTGNNECNHAFVRQNDEGTRKLCVLCGRKVSWRKEHERGNIELGFKSRQTRIVTHNTP